MDIVKIVGGIGTAIAVIEKAIPIVMKVYRFFWGQNDTSTNKENINQINNYHTYYMNP